MPGEPKPQTTTLYFKTGGSDKVYQAAIEPSSGGGGFLVNFAFGRRGNTMQTGTKTSSPVDFPSAKKIFDKLIAEKTAKGYTPGEDGTPYLATNLEARATGIFPQLLNPIEESEVEALMQNPDWFAQEKFDGKRLLLRKTPAEITGINRTGLTVALSKIIADFAATLVVDQWLIDGEALGDRFIVFDLLEHSATDLRKLPYKDRLQKLTTLVPGNPKSPLSTVETATTHPAKSALLARLANEKREGIVFKNSTAPYNAGRPHSGGPALKFKFVATASCIVAAATKAKRSVALELLDSGIRIPVGNVTIAPNTPIPPAGAIVEIRYLYAYRGGSLYQPRYLGQREDIPESACLISQLKYKPEEDAES